ncbi:helix-turn-helix domain-containing protein [Streptomyces sp. ISL-98]|uniref:helix-turn-helix domain-containing protein n=1 Tax=Streptomyces sp. ISL-98 TaxID=2819192 RepID=UPI001BECE02A|nr:helix-turn-helix transcriptional regulator [Streptomyces sp. ISL-98]MBT2508874.1 helix-turn-helix domain-containing protein [Streptomyces sp. ISL-98]
MTTPVLRYKLVSIQLLELLMRRTGRGDSVSVRQLADRASVPHGTIGNLLTGEQEGVFTDAAERITNALGVDLLVLFIPVQRAESSTTRPRLSVTA